MNIVSTCACFRVLTKRDVGSNCGANYDVKQMRRDKHREVCLASTLNGSVGARLVEGRRRGGGAHLIMDSKESPE